MKLLLDTNVYSALAQGEAATVSLIQRADELMLSVVVIGELRYGFRFGERLVENESMLLEFLNRPFVATVPVTEVTADRYARIANSLRRRGRPIPQNDMWIAAQAMEHGADLCSFDGHFENIEGIVWVTP